MEIGIMQQQAKRLHTHTVVFARNSDEDFAARFALRGLTTKAIARLTGLSESQVQYRIGKAEVKRADYRNGTSPLAKEVLRITDGLAATVVRRKIAPKFLPLSATRLNQ